MGDVVNVQFSASAGNFTSTVNEVKSELEGLSESVTALSGPLMEIAELLGAAFVVDKIKEFTEEVAETAIQVKSLADVSGLSVGNIQTLQFAMELTGGNAEAAGVMIQRFERSIFEASAGSGEAYKDFQRLGVSLHELRTASPTELFMKTLDGFKGITDASERADIQMRLFSRSAQRLGPVLVQGSAGFDKMKEQLDETSARMNQSRVDAWDEYYQQIVKTDDAFKGLGMNIS
jgi:methyl-accepting chemotaxis protein